MTEKFLLSGLTVQISSENQMLVSEMAKKEGLEVDEMVENYLGNWNLQEIIQGYTLMGAINLQIVAEYYEAEENINF